MMTRLWNFALALATVWALQACGGNGGGGSGGGGGGGGQAPVPVPPTITSQPQSLSIDLGQAANFSVVASGDAPLAYQWQLDGVDVSGATAVQWSFTPTAVTGAARQVSVRLSNGAGSVTSAAASLIVRPRLQVRAIPLAAGVGHTLAVRADGRVLSWGSGQGGGLAGAGGGSATPVVLAGLTDARAVVADGDGGYRGLALRVDGSALGWGEASAFGADPTSSGTAFVAAPAAMPLVGAAAQVVHCGSGAGGAAHGAAFAFSRRADGSVDVLPASISWQGSGRHASSAAPITGLTGVSELIELSGATGCAPLVIAAAGALVKLQPELVDSFDSATGTTTRRYPISISAVGGVPAVRAGHCFGGGQPACLVVAQDGSVWAWGHVNYSTWLPGARDGATALTLPARMPGLADIVQVATNGAVGFARDGQGRVWSWSAAGGGVFRLGRGDGSGDPVPGLVSLPARATWISASASHAVALLADGTVWTWGRTQNGQRGDGSFETVTLTPVQVPGINLN